MAWGEEGERMRREREILYCGDNGRRKERETQMLPHSGEKFLMVIWKEQAKT